MGVRRVRRASDQEDSPAAALERQRRSGEGLVVDDEVLDRAPARRSSGPVARRPHRGVVDARLPEGVGVVLKRAEVGVEGQRAARPLDAVEDSDLLEVAAHKWGGQPDIGDPDLQWGRSVVQRGIGDVLVGSYLGPTPWGSCAVGGEEELHSPVGCSPRCSEPDRLPILNAHEAERSATGHLKLVRPVLGESEQKAVRPALLEVVRPATRTGVLGDEHPGPRSPGVSPGTHLDVDSRRDRQGRRVGHPPHVAGRCRRAGRHPTHDPPSRPGGVLVRAPHVPLSVGRGEAVVGERREVERGDRAAADDVGDLGVVDREAAWECRCAHRLADS